MCNVHIDMNCDFDFLIREQLKLNGKLHWEAWQVCLHLLAASVQLRVPDERFPSHGVVKFLRAAAAAVAAAAAAAAPPSA